MAEMTAKERILGAVTGQPIDRVPWSPFLAYYWEKLAAQERAAGQIEYMKRMGADPLLRGSHTLFDSERRGCDVTTVQRGNQICTTYTTRVGSLTEIKTYSAVADSWFLTGHPVRTEEDFKTLQYIMENTVVTENARAFELDFRDLGDDGLLVPSVGLHSKTSFQSLVEHWCGTEALVYALCDFPEVVEECLAVMWVRDEETLRCSLNSSAEVFNFFEDSSTTNISPALFEQYTAPEINAWGNLIHAEGKLLLHHACGHLKDLLAPIARTQIDVLESVSPPPTGNIDIADCAARLPEHNAIVGGIEPTFFKNCTLDELEQRVKILLRDMKGRRYVLANSDSCPPGVEYEKFRLVSELVRSV